MLEYFKLEVQVHLPEISPPIIFEYLDASIYLQAYYKYRKTLDKKFSYASWSNELGFNSRSFLRMIVMGKKKIPTTLLASFLQNIFFEKTEKTYFEILVKYSQCSSQKEKQALGQELLKLIKMNEKTVPITDISHFISSPLIPRLFALLSFEDISCDVTTLANLLKESESKILEALRLLKDIGLITDAQQQDKVRWKANSQVFKIPDRFGNLDLVKFHQQSLQEALASFQRPINSRRYYSALLPLSEENFEEFWKVIDDFCTEQITRHNSSFYGKKRLFQMNFNILAVTEALVQSVDFETKTMAP